MAGRIARVAALAALVTSVSVPVSGQAFTPPAQVGSVTFSWQWVDNTGHFLSDGFLLSQGDSATTSALVEVEYGVTERFAATVGTPYVFARYTGGLPPFSRLDRDACRCWHSSFQDFSVGGRYRFGDQFWAVTPQVRFTVPTHSYAFEGEAVVGRRLKELQLGLNAGARLTSILPRASVQASYTYSVVEEVLDGISINRSNGSFDLGYPLTRSLFVRGVSSWQRTHGGLRAGSPSLPFPGDLNTPERYAQRDRLLRTMYWHFGGGLAYSLGRADVYAAVDKYVWGRDAHNGITYTMGTTFYFDLAKPQP